MQLIFSEYESYYELKFDKKPKIVKKLSEDQEPKRNRAKSSTKAKPKPKVEAEPKPPDSPREGEEDLVNPNLPLSMQGMLIRGSAPVQTTLEKALNAQKKGKSREEDSDVDNIENRLLKPLPQYGGDKEMRTLCDVISREIYQESPNVNFADITGLDDAKRLLAEAIQLPLKFPTLFTGILRPWRGILLHGPPGTGKTLLAKAVATECRTTFFNISASTLVSKWRGDSEKLVRCLFELARYHAPSTIFLDEMDSILSARGDGGGGGGEHESSRRMKTELLIQMDGLRGYKASESVFVLAASNLPWDLDVAVLRRLEKRVLVSLPIQEAREEMVRHHLSSRASDDVKYEEIAKLTEGYSGADIELLCRESAMRPVRRLMTQLQSIPEHPLPIPPTSGTGTGNPTGGSSAAVKSVQLLKQAADDVVQLLKSDPVVHDDIVAAISITKPSSDGKISKYEDWQKEFGST